MKSNLRKEINEILSDKLDDAVKAFHTQRDQDFEELIALGKTVELAETERADVQKKMGDLNTAKTSDLAEYNRLTQKLTWLERQLKGKQNQVDALMGKLTKLEVDPKTLTLLLTYHEKKGHKNEKG